MNTCIICNQQVEPFAFHACPGNPKAPLTEPAGAAIASQLFGMRKVRVQFFLEDGSIHEANVVGWSDTGKPRVSIEVEDFAKTLVRWK